MGLLEKIVEENDRLRQEIAASNTEKQLIREEAFLVRDAGIASVMQERQKMEENAFQNQEDGASSSRLL